MELITRCTSSVEIVAFLGFTHASGYYIQNFMITNCLLVTINAYNLEFLICSLDFSNFVTHDMVNADASLVRCTHIKAEHLICNKKYNKRFFRSYLFGTEFISGETNCTLTTRNSKVFSLTLSLIYKFMLSKRACFIHSREH